MSKQHSSTTLKPSDFVHLHNHTQYSLLDGLQKVPEMLDTVKELGMEAIAMTDHGTLSGAIEFYKEAKARDIKPIIGMETYVASRKHTDKDPVKDKGRYHLILLSMNNKGYENLMRLSTIANLDGYYYKPRVDHELLEQYNEGLICLSACMGGELGDLLSTNQDEQAKQVAAWYKSVFGDRYYIELQDHGHPDAPLKWDQQVEVNRKLMKIAEELDIKCVVTCDAHYLHESDQEAHEILLCVQTGAFLADEDRMSLKDFHLHVTEPLELIGRWGAEHPDYISNTKEIADRCNVEFELGRILIPKFPVPAGMDEKSFLDQLVYQGLAWRYGEVSETESKNLSIDDAKKTIPEPVLQRAVYELGVIDQMGFNGYFLIIWDFINWGKGNGIIFGPGRGSAAGSIIAYSLKITELDPLKYDLLFERFLNPDRISMPDVDVDIQDSRRDEVIQYCVQKYGKERVANIVTFGKMMGRNAIRDVSRVLQVPYADADRLAKLVPPPAQGRHIPLKKSINETPELKHEYDTNPTAKRVMDLAVRVEGTIRSHGVHAAGVVIAPDDIVKFVPLELAQKGVIATQYPMGPIEELGLLKMDFLGLSNLTIIKNALRIIKRVYDNDIDISTIPLDDQKTFDLLARGDTTGVFQFESSGMKRYLRELKPTVFDDVVAMGALYRPGPLSAGLTDSYIKRKNGLEPVSYAHPLMEAALGNTFGVLVYQEQVMQISRDVCGFTGGEADTLRKAIGKKKIDVMEKMKVKFIDGAVANGVDKALIEKFWKDLLGFADYCFNKSHSACYGLISYQTAYLKAHYPSAFMAALMTSDMDDTDRLAIEISECQHMGIEVLPPDVNESFAEFAVVPGGDPMTDKVRFGMAAVKNVGEAAVDEIVRIRNENGKFASLEDFVKRVSTKSVNRKVWESLIRAGAYDRFASRGDLLHNLDAILAFGARLHKEAAEGQSDLFGGLMNSDEYIGAISFESAPNPPTEREQLQWERELLGLYLSNHPLKMFDTYLKENAVATKKLTQDMDGKTVQIGGIISAVRQIVTKNNAKMAFVKLEDQSGDVELIVFPSVFEEHESLLVIDNVVIARGKINAKDREGNLTSEIKILADELREITPESIQDYHSTGIEKEPPKFRKKKIVTSSEVSTSSQSPPTLEQILYLQIKDPKNADTLLQLKQQLNTAPGERSVVLVLGEGEQKTAIRLPFRIDPHQELLGNLTGLLGESSVVLR